ncbi:MAG: acetyltransferase [Lentimicrobium sp.]|jgi:sugar O-acyltransferase (sialic acid O-acetyltransferase NeuD family)|nr:acetyltransferase [Lentimicrobium sp.]MDD2526733.1 acetyltransferase [Lentimicrobiaceae bacterium]MDD4596457.1 acetyltransferase [Lentimicrobiaceae bacterium]MDY0024699.1 acetyltransferase [Lentimicrobium sp.]
MNKGLILLGGGGHCRSVIEAIEHSGKLKIAGILDPGAEAGQTICDYPILGTDALIPSLHQSGHAFIITIGQIKNPAPRIALFDLLQSLNADILTITDRKAVVSGRSTIGKGTVVLRHTFINSNVTLGNNNIINTGAIVEHDSTTGDHVHISTGAIVNGNCHIGNRCFIGTGAIILNNITIADDVLVGAGAVVLRNITKPGIYHGNPARII